jgi:lipoprotein-releasing system ATP-binding protein
MDDLRHCPPGNGLDTPLVCVRGVSKSFFSSGVRIDILKEVDLDIRKGETIAVVGASGIGKSTFLHILGTLDKPDSGSITFKGQDILAMDPTRLAEFRNTSIGFVFQFHHLLPEFSALENTMMPSLIQGQPFSRAREVAERILVRVGLKDRLSHRVGLLSGGEQQRVALARALVMQPDLILADEPTGNLDQANSEAVHSLLMELNRELHMTMVVVTHNRDLAALMSRHVTLQHARLVETH